MRISLFDVQTGFGGAAPGCAEVVGVRDWLEEMQRLDIARALVRMVPVEMDTDAPASNAALYAACAGQPSLLPCPVVAPATGGDFLPEDEQVAMHIRLGAGAVCIRPATDYWSLAAWASGALFAALERRRLPVLCRECQAPMEQVAEIARRHPALPLLLVEVNYRQHRTLLALLQAFPNIYLSIGNNYVVHAGIEQFVAEVGAERLLFGSGFPAAETMGAITLLAYAEITDAQKQLIGAGNMERLLEGIIR